MFSKYKQTIWSPWCVQLDVDPVLYCDADLVIRNRQVAALDDNGCLMPNTMRACTIQVCLTVIGGGR